MAKEIARIEGHEDSGDWLEIDARIDSARQRFLMWDKLSGYVALVIVQMPDETIRANTIDPADCKEALIHPDCFIDRKPYVQRRAPESTS